METTLTLQGRRLTSADLVTIRQLLATHPAWHRTRLSQELCRRWHWVNDKGRLKDMAARALLRKLDTAGSRVGLLGVWSGGLAGGWSRPIHRLG